MSGATTTTVPEHHSLICLQTCLHVFAGRLHVLPYSGVGSDVNLGGSDRGGLATASMGALNLADNQVQIRICTHNWKQGNPLPCR